MTETTAPLVFTIAPMGLAYLTETQNAASVANREQRSFQFVVDPEPVEFDEAKYKLPNGAMDHLAAIRDLQKLDDFKRRMTGELILVTAAPHSDRETTVDYTDRPLYQQCYYYYDRVPGAMSFAFISTYVWQHLPPVAGVQTTAAGLRSVQPYLLSAFAVLALSRCVRENLPFHEETRGCPLDYCDVVADIDRFYFQERRFCSECRQFIKAKQREGAITGEQLSSIQWLLRRATGAPERYDVFISHASEDKEVVARPLYEELTRRGMKVWFDEATLELGDSLGDMIDDGLAHSRYGVVILSPRFFEKHWPQEELDRLVKLENDGTSKILPILHQLEPDALRRYSPLLASRIAVRSSVGVPALAEQILSVVTR